LLRFWELLDAEGLFWGHAGAVIAEFEGGASRREAAEEFNVSASTATIWVKCFRETGRCAAKPRGGSISPLENRADFLLGLIEKQPDLTLDEVVFGDAQAQESRQPHRGLALL
jgi:transposase